MQAGLLKSIEKNLWRKSENMSYSVYKNVSAQRDLNDEINICEVRHVDDYHKSLLR